MQSRLEEQYSEVYSEEISCSEFRTDYFGKVFQLFEQTQKEVAETFSKLEAMERKSMNEMLKNKSQYSGLKSLEEESIVHLLRELGYIEEIGSYSLHELLEEAIDK